MCLLNKECCSSTVTLPADLPIQQPQQPSLAGSINQVNHISVGSTSNVDFVPLH